MPTAVVVFAIASSGGLVCLLVILFILRLRFNRLIVDAKSTVKVMVVLGSGGHTTEMLALIEGLDETKLDHTTWVIADSDKTSIPKLQREKQIAKGGLLRSRSQSFQSIPRSREVGQGWISSILTTGDSLRHALKLVLHEQPDLLLVNGPGTCVPVVISAVVARAVLGKATPRIVFIESFCRVDSLSMTGRILYHIADRFVVQWPELRIKYERAEYLGCIF
jgi:beta-1,4-N-acetylglucosaminyltransferase